MEKRCFYGKLLQITSVAVGIALSISTLIAIFRDMHAGEKIFVYFSPLFKYCVIVFVLGIILDKFSRVKTLFLTNLLLLLSAIILVVDIIRLIVQTCQLYVWQVIENYHHVEIIKICLIVMLVSAFLPLLMLIFKQNPKPRKTLRAPQGFCYDIIIGRR